MIKVSSLTPNKDNPRRIDAKQLDKMIQSIKDFPEMMVKRPMVCVTAENGKIYPLGGNSRLKAIIKIGMEEIPASWVDMADDWTEEQRKEFIIKDNVNYGLWEYETLKVDYQPKKLQRWGIEMPAFKKPEPEAHEDEYEETEEIQVDVKPGDIIVIGRHKLICGDSTNVDDVLKLMDGEKADLAHNDPPYGMKKESVGVINDNLNYNDLLQFNEQWIPLQFSVLKQNGSWYCWGIDEPLMDIYVHILKKYIKERKATFRNLITWDKGHGQSQNSDRTRSFATADEKCLFVAMGLMGETINGCDYNGEYDKILKYLKSQEEKSEISKKEMKEILGKGMYSHYMTNSQFTLISKPKYEKLQELTGLYQEKHSVLKEWYQEAKEDIRSKQFYFNNTHDNMNNVWHFSRHKREGNEGSHATPKPILLCERVIKSSCPEEGLVLDFFLGSGSTMVACEQLNRTCYGIELDPRYCQVIINRMKQLNKDLEVKINGEPYEA